jgi:hypothetical protein
MSQNGLCADVAGANPFKAIAKGAELGRANLSGMRFVE